MIARFKKRLESHGASAEGNPSGGNIYRGLYNIALKSCGAAQKKAPDLSLDHTLEYGECRSQRCGFMFMDSPGNDLESIAYVFFCSYCNHSYLFNKYTRTTEVKSRRVVKWFCLRLATAR